jgi:hypothetical protein
MRTIFVVLSAFLASCTHTSYQVSPDSDYYTTLQVDGCPRYLPGDKKVPPDRALVPTYSLERTMFRLIDDPSVSKQLEKLGNTQACWYETPDKSVRMEVGDFCGVSFQVTIRKVDGRWIIVKTESPIAMCHERRR